MASMAGVIDMPFEFKGLDEDKPGTFSGYGSIFGNVDSDGDIVAKGAFKDSLKKRMPALLWQHRRDMPIGRFLEAKEDGKGLFVKGQFLLEGKGKEAYELIKMGAINGLSVGFRTVIDEWDKDKGIRTIKQAELYEISAVTFAANEVAQIHAVKEAGEIKSQKDLERYLISLGDDPEQAAHVAKNYYSAEQHKHNEALAALNSLKQALTGN